jgi:hypothetical protein
VKLSLPVTGHLELPVSRTKIDTVTFISIRTRENWLIIYLYLITGEQAKFFQLFHKIVKVYIIFSLSLIKHRSLRTHDVQSGGVYPYRFKVRNRVPVHIGRETGRVDISN